MHRIVVVGGGAAGSELVTRLGERLGRRRRAQVTLVECARAHLWKPLLHEVATGSLDPGDYEVNYLAQAHWHGFRYYIGEMTGLDRSAKEVRLAATLDDEGRRVTPPRSVGYDTLVIAIGSITNDFGTPGVARACGAAGNPGPSGAVQPAPHQCLPARADAGRPDPGGPASRRDHRCRRDRHRTGRRAASHVARSGCVRA